LFEICSRASAAFSRQLVHALSPRVPSVCSDRATFAGCAGCSAMADKKKKICYYEVLGCQDRKCDVAEIKAAYRKLALKMHPDKAQMNNMTVEEATSKFQIIQEAYGVLSDAQERAWYDAHREQILKGDDEPGEDPFKTKINLYKFFSSGCYDGFTDKANGFYAVYADLFVAINTEEEEWEDKDSSDEDRAPMPLMGNSGSEWADVSSFYKNWLDFCSRKAFGHADKWNPKDAENRQVRRAMEQENKKARQAAKKEFNVEVRQLVKFVQKRDPRVAAHQKQAAKESAEKAQKEAADKERKKKEEVVNRQARKEAQRLEEEERWKEVQAQKEESRARGEVVSDDEESEEEELVEYSCEACRKSFKSEKQYEAHAKSKKHLQAVAALRKQMEKEMAAEAAAAALAEEEEDDEEEDSDEDVDIEAGGVKGLWKAVDGMGQEKASSSTANFNPPSRSGAAAKNTTAEASDDDDDDEDDDDAFLSAFAGARGKQQKNGRAAPNEEAGGATASTAGGGDEKEADDDDEDDDNEELEDLSTLGGKAAQKKAKQKALMLEKIEKDREREQLQETIKSAKKGLKKETPVAKEDPAANNENVVLEPGQTEGESKCAVCSEVFSSRSKMFQHIKSSGHAAFKEAADVGGASKGKKKKR